MSSFRIHVVSALLILLLVQFGCRVRCPSTSCRPIGQRPVQAATVWPASNAVPGVTQDFGLVPNFADSQNLVQSAPCGTPLVFSLEDAFCSAAQNSAAAKLLGSQLNRLKTSSTPVECPGSLDLALRSQMAEEQNRSASLAGQIFLGLVEVELQRELLVEAHERLISVNRTVREAESEGVATSDAKDLIAKQTIAIARRESELNVNGQKLNAQLKALLNLESCQEIEVSYELRPKAFFADVESEKSKAISFRAELIALRQTIDNWNQCSAEAASSILRAADPRLGAKLNKAVTRRLLLRFRNRNLDDPCDDEALRRQSEQLLDDRTRAIHLTIEEAIYDAQFAFEKLALAVEEIERLEGQVEKIEAKRELDATESYIELQKNWYDTLLARSERISKAIEFEAGLIRLAEATGELGQMCENGAGFSCGFDGL